MTLADQARLEATVDLLMAENRQLREQIDELSRAVSSKYAMRIIGADLPCLSFDEPFYDTPREYK